MEVPEEYLRQIFDAADLDKDGQVNFMELISAPFTEAVGGFSLLRDAFEQEQDQDKPLSFDELKEYAKNLPSENPAE